MFFCQPIAVIDGRYTASRVKADHFFTINAQLSLAWTRLMATRRRHLESYLVFGETGLACGGMDDDHGHLHAWLLHQHLVVSAAERKGPCPHALPLKYVNGI